MQASSPSACGRNVRPASVRIDAAAHALEQRRAELTLEQVEAPADRGLREVQERGGLA